MRRKLVITVLLSWLVSYVLISVSAGQDADLAVVVNPKNSVSNVSSEDLRKILAGEKRSWPGGVPIKIIVRAAGCPERLVLLRILGMSESEYKRYWTGQVLRGEADSEPLTVFSFGMVKEATMVFPGAIGLVNAQNLKPGMNLKIIKVDGHMPGDTGYPVH